MEKNSLLKIAFIVSLIGVLFSGYLSATRLLSSECATREGCVYFFGYPTCFYGFIMFLVLLILTGLALFSKSKYSPKSLMNGVLWVSLLGIIFSGYFIIQELFISPVCPPDGCTLIFPTCVYGFFAYLIVFACAYFFKK